MTRSNGADNLSDIENGNDNEPSNEIISEKRLSLKELLTKKDPNQAESISKIEAIEINEEELWDDVGLHKPLGGSFFRNFTYMLIGAVIGVVTVTFVLSVLIPFPISKGYYDISQGLFAFVFMIFDVGTAFGIERFIGEYLIKDKRKMMKYVSFYIWYQMFTGLIQITIISWWIFTTVPYGNFAHLSWILLVINAKQYPGMLGTFNEVLKGMQAYDKSIVIDFIGTQGFQFATQIIFFIGGRYWGMAHPQIGELLGLSIGMVLGYYIDDFFTMGLAIYYFNKTVKKFGFTSMHAWIPSFDWDIAKQCLKFGIGIAWAPIIRVGVGLITLTMALDVVPGYANWIVLAGIGKGLAQSMNMGGDLDLRSVMAESINNGKKQLSSFYLTQAFKYWAFIFFALGGIIVVLLPIIGRIIGIVPEIRDQYELALVFVVPGILAFVWDVPKKHFERVITAASKVMLKSTTEFICMILDLVVWILYLYVFEVWNYGTIGILLLFVWADLQSKILTVIIYTIYVHRNIIKIRIAWHETLIAPIITFVVVLLLGYAIVYGFLVPLLNYLVVALGPEAGMIVTGVIGVIIILIGFMIFVFPFVYALAGGWDAFGLETLRKSYLLSGPSKPFVIYIYKLSVLGSKISPLYNKFSLDYSKAFEEAKELVLLKKIDDARLKAEIEAKGQIEI